MEAIAEYALFSPPPPPNGAAACVSAGLIEYTSVVTPAFTGESDERLVTLAIVFRLVRIVTGSDCC